MQHPLRQTWDLDSLFPGGSESPQFARFLDDISARLETFRQELAGAGKPVTAEEAESLSGLVETLQHLMGDLMQADSFTACLAAENQDDKRAVQLGGKVKSLNAEFHSALTRFDSLLLAIPDRVWEGLLHQERWRPVAFALNERRMDGKEKLPPEQEALVSALAVDGYHGWGELYDTTVSQVRIPHETKDGVVLLSAGQASNKLHSPDRAERSALFDSWEASWENYEDFCADALNHLGGFRLQLYKQRGWDSVLKEPLSINRMSAKTLNVMWEVIDRNKDVFVRYMNRKAELLGVERLAWHDVEAPIGSADLTFTYDEGAKIIVQQFRRFSPKMADFAEMAFEKGWIEAEDRPGKRPGGFCTSFPVSEETRIFMTYGGTADNVSTLAHELGHGFHQHVMTDLPVLSQNYAMNVAETASTFAEMVVSDAAVRQAEDASQKLALLDDKIQRSIAFFMNIHARFLFETRFYEERKKGIVGADQLSELMVEAQREAYRDALSEYHPHFWASKLHFYITDVPFYNFPYTFGYLFSAGIYAFAEKEGSGFEDRYIALLRDTGRMTVEELALKHLGVNLEQPEFWQQAVDLAVRDVEQFIEMTNG
ncbi:oligoendopeptidase [Paenibacillus sp. J31TS4]|uniref:M3 family oligoendopeptidase n=1 Tax=Paenibacillus sp. J31TS4 TaxID=2807195 RepID=UPI001B1FD7B7|nr:M3 family oligoendopeptidase [Paenibacillus sp. J31TS4]GIP40794.1 oligoendopeptidase [Paenibacillus sp. J31TS4]